MNDSHLMHRLNRQSHYEFGKSPGERDWSFGCSEMSLLLTVKPGGGFKGSLQMGLYLSSITCTSHAARVFWTCIEKTNRASLLLFELLLGNFGSCILSIGVHLKPTVKDTCLVVLPNIHCKKKKKV